MPLQLLISDLDGTILETEDYHRLAYNALFKELDLGTVWSKKDYVDRLQTMGGDKFREIFSWFNLPEEQYEENKKKLYRRKTELYVELITKDLDEGKLQLRPGVARLFGLVQEEGIPIAIATACVGWAAQKVLVAALGQNFLDSLSCLCGGESTRRHKPAPDVYLLVSKKTGTPTDHCLVLEDTKHGVAAAKAAGMACLATPSEFALEHDFSKADLVVEDLETPVPLNLSDLRSLIAAPG